MERFWAIIFVKRAKDGNLVPRTVISQRNGENWDVTDFKTEVVTRCSEYSEWTLSFMQRSQVLTNE